MGMSNAAKEAKRLYMKTYMKRYRERPDVKEKQREYNMQYWERKAEAAKNDERKAD